MNHHWPYETEFEAAFLATKQGRWAFKELRPAPPLLGPDGGANERLLKEIAAWIGDPRVATMCHWLADRNQTRPLVEHAATVLLDYIVRSSAPTEFTTVISVVGSHATVEIQGLTGGGSVWYYYTSDGRSLWEQVAGELVVIYPELFLESSCAHGHGGPDSLVVPRATTWSEMLRELGDTLTWHRQVRRLTVDRIARDRRAGTVGIRLHVRSSIAPYWKGKVCRCIPLPGKPPKPTRLPGLPISIRTPEVVLASQLVHKDLRALAQVWQDRFAKSVLLCGPPGSGKEVYAQTIPYGSGRDGGALQVISLGESEDGMQIERRLFGCRKDDGQIVGGLIERAQGSAMFVDEAHYPDDKPGIRAALLRVLETGSYYPCGSDVPRDVGDVLWVFASSRTVSGVRSIGSVPPPDFWTRMTHLIQIHHPLNAEELRAELSAGLDCSQDVRDSQVVALERLFKYFWITRLEEYFNRELSEDPAWWDTDASQTGAGGRDDSAEWPVLRATLRAFLSDTVALPNQERRLYCGRSTDSNPGKFVPVLDAIANMFAKHLMEEVGSSHLHTISIRGVRSMVSQLLTHALRAYAEPDERAGGRAAMAATRGDFVDQPDEHGISDRQYTVTGDSVVESSDGMGGTMASGRDEALLKAGSQVDRGRTVLAAHGTDSPVGVDVGSGSSAVLSAVRDNLAGVLKQVRQVASLS